MRAVIAGACLAVVAVVTGCGKPPVTTTAPPRTNAMVTLGDMVLIPSGSFAMGNCMEPVNPRFVDRVKAFVKREPRPGLLDNYPDELPVHRVTVSAFYMDKYEVTKEKWDEVYQWAVTNGYMFENAGEGKAPNHPVHSVSWYDCVKWCNARSEKEGLTPCYYVDAGKSNVYRTDQTNRTDRTELGSDCVNWSTNGYRLPTEAEWEKAARGGLAGCRFPWGDSISHDQANYQSDKSRRYDVSMTRGLHPGFTTGGAAYTSPVGTFDPNGYGLYDSAGNVLEWCWDWYDESYYASSPGSNPRGPAGGTSRVLRGGCWLNYAYGSRCAVRCYPYPVDSYNYIGFRCVRWL